MNTATQQPTQQRRAAHSRDVNKAGAQLGRALSRDLPHQLVQNCDQLAPGTINNCSGKRGGTTHGPLPQSADQLTTRPLPLTPHMGRPAAESHATLDTQGDRGPTAPCDMDMHDDQQLPEFLIDMGYPNMDNPAQPPSPPLPDQAVDVMEALYTAASAPATNHPPINRSCKGWPFPAQSFPTQDAEIYEAARRAAEGRATPPRIDHTTSLKTDTWERESTNHPADDIVIRGIKFGFSTQYAGPPILGPTSSYNHKSAMEYPADVDNYVARETRDGALSGPYTKPPFVPWFVSSPIMTREKSGGDGRRIIVDLSYPDGGVNLHIAPHVFDGRDAVHNLPTIDSAVATIAATPPGDVCMAVIDLSRAYRQFPVAPLDWPILGIFWKGAWSFDKRLPFGCRMSSFAMQSIAEFIVRALHVRKVNTHMYLDDIVIISPTLQIAKRDFADVLTLLDQLGLQVAVHKLQHPSTIVTWLGVTFDIRKNQLSIQRDKLDQIKHCMALASRKQFITKKHLQRLIGLANHLAKVVRAARVFICRLLAALRAATTNTIRVSREIRADIAWYVRHLKDSDGRAIIPTDRITTRLWVDACPKGAGASDGSAYYEHVFDASFSASHHIVHLEALNCLAAVRTFTPKLAAGGTIEVMCDNRASVDAFTSGRARDGVLAACSRALWFHAASADVQIKFTHVPGERMALPDALSRASIDASGRARADDLIRRLSLKRVRVGREQFQYRSFL